jgi:hypothetical protein
VPAAACNRPAAQPTADRGRRDEVVSAFIAAARDGDFDQLLTLLDPDVVLRADASATEAAAVKQAAGAPLLSRLVRGASPVATAFAGRARGAQPALIDGAPGAVFAPDGEPRAVFDFLIVDGRIVAIEVLAEAEQLAQLEITFLDR